MDAARRRALSIGLAALVVLALAWEVRGAARSYRWGSAGTQDYIEYWTAGQALREGKNPYDVADLHARQVALGNEAELPAIMWNPPWLLAWIYPLLLLPFLASAAVWLVLDVALALLAAWLAWRVLAKDADAPRWLPFFVTLAFFPTLYALAMGQMSVLLLVGVAGFLYSVERGSELAAGACLALTSTKPHFVHLVWVAAVLWAIAGRRWRFVLGGALPLLFGAIVLTALRPEWLHDYRAAYAKPPTYWFPDTLGAALRKLVAPEVALVQFAPALAADLLLVGFVAWKRPEAAWREQLPRLVTLSALTSAYGWSFDQVTLLVPLLALLARERRRALAGFALISLALTLENLLGALPPWSFWTPLAVLGIERITSRP